MAIRSASTSNTYKGFREAFKKPPEADYQTIFNMWSIKYGDSVHTIYKENFAVEGGLDWLETQMVRTLCGGGLFSDKDVLNNQRILKVQQWVVYTEDDLMTDAKRIRLVNKEDDGNSK